MPEVQLQIGMVCKFPCRNIGIGTHGLVEAELVAIGQFGIGRGIELNGCKFRITETGKEFVVLDPPTYIMF